MVAAGAVAACVVAVPAVQRYRKSQPLRASDKIRVIGSITILVAACMMAVFYARKTASVGPVPMRPVVGGRSVSVPMPPPPRHDMQYGGNKDYTPFKYEAAAVPVPPALAVGGASVSAPPAPAPVVPVAAGPAVPTVPAVPVVPAVPDIPIVPVGPVAAAPVDVTSSITVDGGAVVLEGFQF